MKKIISILFCCALLFSACGAGVETEDDQYWQDRLDQCAEYDDLKCEEATLRDMEEGI